MATRSAQLWLIENNWQLSSSSSSALQLGIDSAIYLNPIQLKKRLWHFP